MTRWMPSLDIQVVDRVLVERLGALAGQDVRQAWRVGQAEDAPSSRVAVSKQIRIENEE